MFTHPPTVPCPPTIHCVQNALVDAVSEPFHINESTSQRKGGSEGENVQEEARPASQATSPLSIPLPEKAAVKSILLTQPRPTLPEQRTKQSFVKPRLSLTFSNSKTARAH